MATLAITEKEWAEQAVRHLKAEMKRAGVTYDCLADRMKAHGFAETKASIANKLARRRCRPRFFSPALPRWSLKGYA